MLFSAVKSITPVVVSMPSSFISYAVPGLYSRAIFIIFDIFFDDSVSLIIVSLVMVSLIVSFIGAVSLMIVSLITIIPVSFY